MIRASALYNVGELIMKRLLILIGMLLLSKQLFARATQDSVGILEIRFKTISTLIPFSPLNSFSITVDSVLAIRSDTIRYEVYEALDSLHSSPRIFNTLDFRAQDSAILFGRTHLPVGHYFGWSLQVVPGNQVVLDGDRSFPVVKPDPFDPSLVFATPFEIAASKTTSMVITVNLDYTLIERTSSYYYHPYYYVSSIHVIDGIEPVFHLPDEFGLAQGYPNPFNPSTSIRYSSPRSVFVSLKIYDLLGGQVATLVDERKELGSYTVAWNASGMPAGVYFYRLTAGTFSQTKKLLLIR